MTPETVFWLVVTLLACAVVFVDGLVKVTRFERRVKIWARRLGRKFRKFAGG